MHVEPRGTLMLVAASLSLTLAGWDSAWAGQPAGAGRQAPAGRPAPSADCRATADDCPPMVTAALRHGRIDGIVRDDRGAPLAGAVVSALGTSAAYGLSDSSGRFTIRELPPGTYVVRAHLSGYAASRRELVSVAPSARVQHAVRLRSLAGAVPAEAPDVLAAGVGAPADAAEEEAAPAERTHDHGETAWRLRHLKRSVLRDSNAHVADVASAAPRPGLSGGAVSFLGRALDSSARFAANLFDDLPFSGQVNFLTISHFDRPQELLQFDGFPRGMAYVSIGAPEGSASAWSVRGAMTDSDVSSWILAGSYRRRRTSPHAIDVGMSYSIQRYEGGNAAALAAVTDGSRNVGAVHAFDRWTISPRVELLYGTRYAWHAYLPDPTLFSPQVGVAVSATDRTHIRTVVSQRMHAPGAEEFVPPSGAGLWLPPARTFSPLDVSQSLRPERARHVEVGVEHELNDRYVLGVRRFQQNVDDQLVTLFGVRDPQGPPSDLGHYYVANAGSLAAGGWGVTFSRLLVDRLWGTVDYSITSATWHAAPSGRADALAPGILRSGNERFHDVTTSLEADIPETATRVLVLYKINSAFARADGAVERPGPDGRFDIQVRQSLPFLRLTSTDWELLVAVRNMFHELERDASVYDELMVVRPPKRLVGGFVVKF